MTYHIPPTVIVNSSASTPEKVECPKCGHEFMPPDQGPTFRGFFVGVAVVSVLYLCAVGVFNGLMSEGVCDREPYRYLHYFTETFNPGFYVGCFLSKVAE